MAKEKYRVNDTGVDLSSDGLKANVDTITIPDDHLADDPDPDMEGPQRQGFGLRDILGTIVSRVEDYDIQFEGENLMLLSKSQVSYTSPELVPRARADLIEMTKLIQKKYSEVSGETLKLELIDEDTMAVSASTQGNKVVWRFTHTLKY